MYRLATSTCEERVMQVGVDRMASVVVCMGNSFGARQDTVCLVYLEGGYRNVLLLDVPDTGTRNRGREQEIGDGNRDE